MSQNIKIQNHFYRFREKDILLIITLYRFLILPQWFRCLLKCKQCYQLLLHLQNPLMVIQDHNNRLPARLWSGHKSLCTDGTPAIQKNF